MQSAPKPPSASGRHSCPPVESVMSSLKAALPQMDGAPMPDPPSFRSPAVIESPTNSRRLGEGGGGGATCSQRGVEEFLRGGKRGGLSSLSAHGSVSLKSIDCEARAWSAAREARLGQPRERKGRRSTKVAVGVAPLAGIVEEVVARDERAGVERGYPVVWLGSVRVGRGHRDQPPAPTADTGPAAVIGDVDDLCNRQGDKGPDGRSVYLRATLTTYETPVSETEAATPSQSKDTEPVALSATERPIHFTAGLAAGM